MVIDIRRCGEAAARAALADALTRPPPGRSRRGRRRLRPLRGPLRLVRVALQGVGLVTALRVAREPEQRRAAVQTLTARLGFEDLLQEIAVELRSAREALADEAALFTSEQVSEYADLLLEKIDQAWYPSGQLPNRLQRLLAFAARAASA